MRYRLRTLLILLAIGPPMLAIGYWRWAEYRAAEEREIAGHFNGPGSRHIFAPVGGGIREILIDDAKAGP